MSSSSTNIFVHQPEHYNLDAPEVLVPYLLEKCKPASVADIGCGIGTFLKVCKDKGIQDILGVDGNWVDRNALFIPQENFIEADLSKNFVLPKKYDLVFCMEVAEHIYEKDADIFIDNLTKAGNVIIFSAALPNQGGQQHVNEQPPAYWAEKFLQKDFIMYDVLRKNFWTNADVKWWYRQNMFLVAHRSVNITAFGFDATDTATYEYVHPELLALYAEKVKILQKKLQTIHTGQASGKLYFSLLGKMIKRKLF